jgi:uncharacterized protein RhaS with RHS repeats
VTTVHEPDGNVQRFAYDALDNVVRAQDRHHDVQYAYRGLGRLGRRVETGTAVEFWHDTEERLRAVVNEHGLVYRFELDGEVITEAGFDGLTRRYVRDAGGRWSRRCLRASACATPTIRPAASRRCSTAMAASRPKPTA